MKKRAGLPGFILLASFISQPGQSQEPVDSKIEDISSSSESRAAASVVRQFFKAFDERDVATLSNLLTPTTQIINDKGVATNTEEMLEFVENAENWWHRTRKLWDFEYTSNGSLAVMGLKNQVNFSLPDNEEIENRYNETWILEKNGMEWKLVRIHYSKINQGTTSD